MMCWAVGAVLLQAMGWAISYTLLAKAKPSFFFLNELFATLWGVPIKMLCYKYWGLTGFGMATMLTYALYLVQVLIVTKKLFGLSLSLVLWGRLLLLHIPVLIVVLFKFQFDEVRGYILGSLVFIIVSTIVLLRLNKIMDLISFVKKYR